MAAQYGPHRWSASYHDDGNNDAFRGASAFVDAELDRRHPERVRLREMHTADDYRAMWDTIERLWSDTVARAERLPEPALHEQVDTELERICTRAPAPGYPEESRSVGDCLGVVMDEECAHHRYAVRDLAVLQAGNPLDDEMPSAGSAEAPTPVS